MDGTDDPASIIRKQETAMARRWTFEALTESINATRAKQGLPFDPGVAEHVAVYFRARDEADAANLASAPRYDLGDGRFGRSHFLTGRFADRYQYVGQEQRHIVAEGDDSGYAICRAIHGRLSGGWSRPQAKPASCPGCVASLSRIDAAIRVRRAFSLLSLWDALETYAEICDAQVFSIDKGGADLDNLPTFGGDRPTWRPGHPIKRIFSWDTLYALVEQSPGPRFSLFPRRSAHW